MEGGDIKTIGMKEKEQLYLIIYRESAFGEEVERCEVLGLVSLIRRFGHTNIVRVHLVERVDKKILEEIER